MLSETTRVKQICNFNSLLLLLRNSGGQEGHFGGGFGGHYSEEGDYAKRKKRSDATAEDRQGFLADTDGGFGNFDQVKIIYLFPF